LFFGELDIKECRAMSFSNGGHLIACVDKDYLRLINSYNCQEMHSIKLRVQEDTEINQVLFSKDDKSLAVCASDGFVGRWELPSYKEIMQSYQDDTAATTFYGIDNYPGEKDIHQVVLAGAVRDKEAGT
jgi:WD40 repeat protein